MVACCGALAVPATASATHMSDMPWCPHSQQQGADPVDQQPTGAGGAPSVRRAPSEAPLGAPAGGSPGSASAAGQPSTRGAAQPARAAQPAQVAQPLRVALTGSTVSPPLGETLAVLGKDSTLRRIQRCVDEVK